jgi:hypothetical protein
VIDVAWMKVPKYRCDLFANLRIAGMVARRLTRGGISGAVHCLATAEFGTARAAGTAMVDPAFRGRGLSAVLYGLTCMLLLFRNQLRPIWMTNVSQVPSVIGLVTETFSNVFPSPDPRQRRSYDHLVIARSIMKHHRKVFGVSEEAGFDEQRFVITNAHTGGSDHLKKSFGEAPSHRIEAYNQMCRQALNYDVGDDFLQVGQIDLAAARNFLLDHVPRAWLRSLVLPLVFLLANASLLPVLHWLSPRRAMGDVRPRLPSPS